MSDASLLHRVQGKLWWIYKYKLPFWRIYKYKLPEWRALLQFYGLLYGLSQPVSLSQKPVMVVSPHEDDEVLGCGGLIALKRERSIPVQVVFITDGSASHKFHPDFRAGEIVPIRKEEARTALGILGVEPTDIHFLDKLDGKLRQMPDLDRQQTIDELTNLIRVFQPGEIYVTHRKDRHSDHEVSYDLIKAAIAQSGLEIELLQYPIWILWRPMLFRDLKLTELAGAVRLPINSVHQKKQRAIAAYRSQCQPISDSNHTILPKGFLRRFLVPYEVFFKTDTF
jgi:LmbE family N-acetylglucosaminyl deacetylase